jgi:3-hydroxybutyryl-CoA dehydrogenase
MRVSAAALILLPIALSLSKPASAEPVPVVEYASPLLSFYVRLPSDWRVAESRDRVDFLHPAFEQSGLEVVVHSSTEPYGPGQFARFKNQMRVAAPGFRVNGEDDARFGGSNGHQIDFENDTDSGVVRHLAVFVESPGGSFFADCRLLAKFAGTLGEDCGPILDSFRPSPTRDRLSFKRLTSMDGALVLEAPPGWRESTSEALSKVPDTVLSLQRPAGTVNFRRASAEAGGSIEEYVAEGARMLGEKTGAKEGAVESMSVGPVELRYSILELPQLEMLTGAFVAPGGAVYGVESVSRSAGLTRELLRVLLTGARLLPPAEAASPHPSPAPANGRLYLLAFIFGAMAIALVYGVAMLYLSLPIIEKGSGDARLHLPGEFIRDFTPRLRTGPLWKPPMLAWANWWNAKLPPQDPARIKRVGVIGAGTMGSGIAQLLAQNAFDVSLFDASPAALRAGLDRIGAGLAKAGKPEALTRIEPTNELDVLGACDLVIEAAFEDLEVKKGLFKKLDALLPSPKTLATNTSSLPVGQIASAAGTPDRVVGIHFFNPAPVMKLVEIVPHDSTWEETLQLAAEFVRRLGKTPVVSADAPGFIANRLARPFYLKPLALLSDGKAGAAELDEALRRRGFKMGPFELMDLIGLDVNLSITRVLHKSLGERFAPSKLQEDLVARGSLGRKSGRGFYVYEQGKPKGENPELASMTPPRSGSIDYDGLFREVLAAVAEEAERMVAEHVASAEDIDTAMRLGFNWPKGPLEWFREISASSR